MSPGHFAPVAQRTPPFHLNNHLEQHSLLLGQRQPVEPAVQAREETLTNAALSARYALAARQYLARFWPGSRIPFCAVCQLAMAWSSVCRTDGVTALISATFVTRVSPWWPM
jgi:hypothetical protein